MTATAFQEVPSVFEAALAQSLHIWKENSSDNENDKNIDRTLLNLLKDKSCDVQYFYNDYMYWNTELYIFDDKFVCIHWQHDGEERDHLIVEGFLENREIKIERLYYKSLTNESVCHSLEELLDKCGGHIPVIPFQFVLETMTAVYHDNHMIDLTHQSGKKWSNVDFMVEHYFQMY